MHSAMSKLCLGRGGGVGSVLHLATIITAPDDGTGKIGGLAALRFVAGFFK
jgi:hypothetical protein